MKLTTKILTSLASIASVGIMIPTIVSCSCGKKAYEINYGDNVDTKNENSENYKKLEDVQKAIKLKADKDPGRVIDNLEDIKIENDTDIQKFYYDIVASHAYCLDVAYQQFNLLNWSAIKPDVGSLTISFTYNDVEYKNATPKYTDKDSKIMLAVYKNGTEDAIMYLRSYTYFDCTYSQE